MPENPLFRKVSLERLSSPEQLDTLLIIVKLKGWIALACLIAITVALLVWSFVGRLPIAAEGRGILLDPGALEGVFSKSEGQITRILALTGAEVEEGDLLVTLEDASLENSLSQITDELSTLTQALTNEKAVFANEQELRQKERSKEIELENLILENQRAKLSILEKELEQAKGGEKLDLEKEILDQKNLIASKKLELVKTLEEIPLSPVEERIARLEQTLEQKKGALKGLKIQKENLVIKAPKSGRVIEIDITLGQEVHTGSPLLWIQAPTLQGETMPFYTFVPLSMGQKIEAGMRAQISLLAVDAQIYGQIEGRVLRVLPYAVSERDQYLAGIPSSLIREYLGEPVAATLVVISPIPDPATPTGYKWTSQNGPPQESVSPGSIGMVRIILESKRPISYVLPIFKE